jgi:hypothetical protein
MDTPQQPQLGYGKPTEVSIDKVNQWMRGQPWYQEQMRQWGQDPGHPNLAKSQSAQILKMAQAQGVTVDQGNMEVDDHGNFNPIGHKLRNTLIVAGIAAAGIAAPYIIPAIAGAGGGGSAAAGLSAVEGGGFGIGTGTVSALGTGAMAAVPVTAGTTAAGLTTAGLTAGHLIGPSTAANVAGTTAVANGAPAGIAATGSGGTILGTLGKMAANKGGDLLTNTAAGIGNERIQNNFADQSAADQNNRALLGSAVFNRDLPSVQTSQVARGDLLSTMHDAAPTGDPRIDKFGGGGLRPSAFGPATQQAGDELKRQALKNLLSGQGQINPQLTTPKRAGFGENALAGAGIGLNILDAYGRFGR